MIVMDHKGTSWDVRINEKKVSTNEFSNRQCAYRCVAFNHEDGTLMVFWAPVFTDWF